MIHFYIEISYSLQYIDFILILLTFLTLLIHDSIMRGYSFWIKSCFQHFM